MFSRRNDIEQLEVQELIRKLEAAGYGKLVDAFLRNEAKVYTKKGRLNKSAACRVLKWKLPDLEAAILACREILAGDLPGEDLPEPG